MINTCKKKILFYFEVQYFSQITSLNVWSSLHEATLLYTVSLIKWIASNSTNSQFFPSFVINAGGKITEKSSTALACFFQKRDQEWDKCVEIMLFLRWNLGLLKYEWLLLFLLLPQKMDRTSCCLWKRGIGKCGNIWFWNAYPHVVFHLGLNQHACMHGCSFKRMWWVKLRCPNSTGKITCD